MMETIKKAAIVAGIVCLVMTLGMDMAIHVYREKHIDAIFVLMMMVLVTTFVFTTLLQWTWETIHPLILAIVGATILGTVLGATLLYWVNIQPNQLEMCISLARTLLVILMFIVPFLLKKNNNDSDD